MKKCRNLLKKIFMIMIVSIIWHTINGMNRYNYDHILKNGAKENVLEVMSAVNQLACLYNQNRTVFAELIEITKDPSHQLSDNARFLLKEYRMLPASDHAGRVMKNTILSLFEDGVYSCPMITHESFTNPFEPQASFCDVYYY